MLKKKSYIKKIPTENTGQDQKCQSTFQYGGLWCSAGREGKNSALKMFVREEKIKRGHAKQPVRFRSVGTGEL